MTPYYADRWIEVNPKYYYDNTFDNNYCGTTDSTYHSSFPMINPINSATTSATQSITVNAQTVVTIDQADLFRSVIEAEQQLRAGVMKEISERNWTPPKRLAPPRPFNRYINASDLMEEFIRYAGEQGVRQGEVLDLPVVLFIKWLVIRACEEDQEEPDVILELGPKPQPRCLGCQRFMRRDTTLPLHGQECAAHLFNRKEAA